MRRSITRCAVVCVAAGVVSMSSVGGVAFADDTSGGDGSQNSGSAGSSGSGAPSPGSAAASSAADQQQSSAPHWPNPPAENTTPRVGPIAPPAMNLPPRLTQIMSGDDGIPVFTSPRDLQLFGPSSTPSSQAGSAGSKPSTSQDVQRPGAAPANAPGRPGAAGQSGPASAPTVPNSAAPLPNPTAAIDLNQPLLPQVLPPPLVLLLSTIADRIHLAALLIDPALDFVVPRFIANALAPNTSPVTAGLPTRNTVPMPLPNRPPPADIAPMGMDLGGAPMTGPLSPEPSPPPEVVGQPRQPNSTSDNTSAMSAPVPFRDGYSDYLRNAGLAQITAIAVPGAVAILLFAVGGGVLGYRQARAGHLIRADGVARFLR